LSSTAEVAATRKMACIVWKVLTTKQPCREEDERLTARKRRTLSWKTKRQNSDPSDIRKIAEDLVGDVTVLERYPVGFNEESGARPV
jgi:DNA-directed RNA polymerase subunit F